MINSEYFQLVSVADPKWQIQYINYEIICGIKQIKLKDCIGLLALF